MQACLDDPAAYMFDARIDMMQPLPALIDALLASFDRDITLDRLAAALAAALGIADARPAERRDDQRDPLDEVADSAPAIGEVLEDREALRHVWDEVVELPPRQRAALLLNLRDPEGGAVLQTLPATGVVSLAAIAEALQMRRDELARLWDDLPLDDLSIAARMGLTRQQVINLRKAARARLARRLERGTRS
jgi:hypothetical protein